MLMSLRQRGSLLIITLWLVTILAVLAVAIARYLSLEIRLTKYRAAREQGLARARAGVVLAMQRLMLDAEDGETDGKAYDWLGDDWAGALTLSGGLAVGMTDEERRLGLNGATAEQLTHLAGSAALAQTILDALDAPDPAEDDPAGDPPYAAKNGPFAALEELSDLPEMTPEAYHALRRATTPYTAAGEPLNLNTVSPEVMRAVGLSERAIQLVTQFREGADGEEAHAQDGIFGEGGLTVTQTLKDAEGVDLTGTPDGALLTSALFGVSSNVFTVTAEARTERPEVRVRLEAVVRRTGCRDGTPAPCIIAWRQN